MNKLIYQVGLLGALLAHAGTASALTKFDYVNIQKSGINIADGKVFVEPVNGNYGKATQSTASYHVEMRAGCKGQNMLKKAFTAFGEEYASGSVIEASTNYRKNVGTNLEATLPWTEVHLQVPLNKLGVNPVQMCQSHLTQKMSQGLTRQQVLSQAHVINQPVTLSAVAGCGKLGKTNDQYGTAKLNTELKIICKAGSAAGIGDIQVQPVNPTPGGLGVQTAFHVTNATFKATPRKVSTTCPAKAKFTGTISASGPGTVQYRVNFPGTAKTGIRELHFDKAGTKNIGLVEYPTNHSLPTATATLEVLSPGNKKAYAHFAIQCIAGTGPGNVQLKPSENASPTPGQIQKQPVQPAPMQIQPAPQPTPKLQLKAVPVTPSTPAGSSAPRREGTDPRSTEEEAPRRPEEEPAEPRTR